MSQIFQAFQAVKVANDKLADHGRVGTVRSAAYVTGEGKSATTVVDVQLDATPDQDEQLVQLAPDDLAPIY